MDGFCPFSFLAFIRNFSGIKCDFLASFGPKYENLGPKFGKMAQKLEKSGFLGISGQPGCKNRSILPFKYVFSPNFSILAIFGPPDHQKSICPKNSQKLGTVVGGMPVEKGGILSGYPEDEISRIGQKCAFFG